MDILRLQWEKIKENIRIEYDITDIAYNIWVKPLKYGKCENKQITILIPDNSPEIQDHIEKNYTDCFQSALSDLLLDNYAVIFLPEEDIQTENNDTVSFMSEDDINAIIEKNEAVG